MKTKPTRHKETNTFKFKPFSERVNDIDVDVFHKVAHRNEVVTAEETETFFYQCIQKWNFLNLSQSYSNFRKEVADIITLPQLLNRKQHVVDTLLKYLKLKDPLCLQTIFDLVIALAKDLEIDFYEYFPEFLTIIIDLLQIRDAEQLENTFHTLAYLFKFQWRYMIKNIDTIFNLLVPLLADTRPPYVNNFAAESFAFVVRKVKDKEAFLSLVLDALEQKPDGVVGCGKLLFHVLAGVPGQFHSCAETMLNIYLSALQDSSIKQQQLLFEVLSTVFKCISSEIHPQKCDILWTVIFESLDKFSSSSLIFLLRLVQILINHKGGVMLKDSVLLSKKFAEVIDKYEVNEELLEEAANATVVTLLASNVKLLQETSSFLILKLLSIDNLNLLLKITEKLIVYSSFETLVLPQLFKKSSFSTLDGKLLGLLAKIVYTKSPPSLSGIGFENWSKFGLNVRNNAHNVTFLSQLLDSLQQSEGEVKEDALKALIILPHLTLSLQEQLRENLNECLSSLYKRVLEKKEHQSKINFAFLLAIECVARLTKPDDFYTVINSQSDANLLSAVVLHDNDVSILNALDICFSYLKNSSYAEEYINQKIFDILHNLLVSKLGSPNSQIRLTISHLFSLFTSVPALTHESEDLKVCNAIELPFLAESKQVTVHKYRSRLVHIQPLDFHGASVSHLNSNYYDLPLHYLFGNLYVNFSLLWEPVTQVISSYATTDCSQFWSVFLAKLKGEENIKMIDAPNFECEILESLSGKILSMKDKIDYDNYKLLLWKCMGQIVSYCEVKNRDYVGLFIDFVEGNFFKSNSEDAKSCSVKKREQPKETQAPEVAVEKADQKDSEEPEDKNEEEGDDEAKEEDEDSKPQLGRIERVKLLLAMLQVLGKFTNVRSLYREPEILRIYLDLLSSKNSEIQKAALHCLYTYRHKYLTPYKEQLDNIVDEKNLKNELARFQISVGEGIEAVVQEEHREGLIPVLMRILHSKMSQRVGMRTGGKTGGLVRRKTILRFLAGVKEEEMMVFVRMAFKPFQNYLPILKLDEASYAAGGVDLQQMVQDIFKNINLENVVPPKRLSSAVNLLAVIIEQFGGKMTEKLLPHLLAILICILAQVAGILLKSSEVHSGYLTSLRNVRNNCINVLARFFAHFENYEWTSSEINALFQVAVFPWLNKLPVEGIHSPTPLLKMFAAWSHNPRYYPLFVKLDEDRKMTPLDSVIRLLLGLKTHKSVLQMILDMVEKMLTLQDFEKEDPDQLMEVDEFKAKSLMPTVTNKLQVEKNDSINYGSAILLPHVTDILVYIERKLKRQARQGASRTELVILSRISEFVSDSKTCDTLLNLVLPILQRKSGDSEEVVMQLLTTVTNLLKHVDEPKKHLRSIQHLLAQITAAPARKMLMQVLIGVARDDEQMKKNQNLLAELNAYDQRWIDQPDFQRRLDAFSEIDRLIKEEESTLEFGVAVILNCFFFLKTENDLAMRDRSGQCLKSIGLYLAKKYSDNSTDRKYLIEDTILTMVRHGIRKQNDNVKFQSIAFLGHMAMECPEVHPVLRDLHALTNKQDPEVDFFENMQHLQLHRKARALLKFCSVAKTLTKAPNPRTLTQFVLPLASSYLCNEKFSNKNSIVDAAIETIGVVCRLLPWNQYEIVLRFYLDKLRTCVEFQRQVIRIVVAILDSFHFDLSKFKGLDEDILKKRGEESLMQVVAVDDDLKAEEEAEAPKETSTESTSKLAASKPDGLVEPEEVTDEHLDEALNDEAIADANEETEEPSEPTSIQDLTPAMEKMTVLSQYMAKRLVYSISKGLLPQLHKAIAMRTRHEGSHKVNKKRISTDQEEEELMRVPIALAMVKLLQKLPQGMLDLNLRGIFTKICTFLKSRLESVRRTTREILQKIMVTLGPDYLHHLLKEMNALLTRGYQVHVLTFTIHAVLVSLKPYFKPAHMRSNLSSILSVCKIDLFGPTAEEKEIAGIVKNVSEARSTKSYDIFHILGEFINEGSLINVVMPLKEVLSRTHSHKTVRKVGESLRQVGLGLADNKYIEIEKMLNFLYGVASESIPQLMPENKKKQEAEEEKKKAEAAKQKRDCFLIQPAPKTRMGIKAIAKTSKNTNAHVMIEFSLRLLHILLKRDKVNDLKSVMDPFVPILSDCLKSQHVKLTTLALQCLGWILKIDLPSVHSSISEMCSSMFNILHKYAVAGLSKGDNYDLVMAAFKTMSVLVRDVKHFVITSDQLKALLIYAEQDLHDSDRQATAFGLLKAIIHRKLVVPEMHQVMEKVAILSVNSELDNVRKQSRAVFYTYLVDYPLGKQLNKHISFYVTQLAYELQPGRLSVLEMIYSIITGFPLPILEKHSALIFLTVGARLVNDDDAICKKVCAKCIKEMITRVSHNQRLKLFDIVITWMKDKKLIHRRLAVQLCGIFVMVEKDSFESRLDNLLPLLTRQFYATDNNANDENQPGRFVKIQKQEDDVHDEKITDPERLKDHHLFQVLQLLLKISANCTSFLKDKKYQEFIDTFAEHSQSLLAHPHLWVRLAASQLLGFILAALNVDKIVHLMNNPDEVNPDDGFVYSEPVDKLRSLILDSTAQLQPETEFEELYDQVIKNLVFIARLLKITSTEQENENKEAESSKSELSLLWLLKKLRKCINLEVSQAPRSTVVRTSVFKWMAGVIATVDIESLKPILFHFMSPLAREMATIEESNAPLRQLAKEVATMIKKKTSVEEYTRLLSQAQQRLDTRRAERKKVRSQQFVTDPELAAKRKIAKQQKKKVARKRKMDNMKGKKAMRKKVKREVDLEVT